MREQILSYLTGTVISYNELNLLTSNNYIQQFLASSKQTIEIDIPSYINNFISIINLVEQLEFNQKVENIEEAIILFSNPKLDTYIEVAFANTHVVAIGSKLSSMTAKQILEIYKDAVRESFKVIQLQTTVAKKMK
jgi:hypothetical protein